MRRFTASDWRAHSEYFTAATVAGQPAWRKGDLTCGAVGQHTAGSHGSAFIKRGLCTCSRISGTPLPPPCSLLGREGRVSWAAVLALVHMASSGSTAKPSLPRSQTGFLPPLHVACSTGSRQSTPCRQELGGTARKPGALRAPQEGGGGRA